MRVVNPCGGTGVPPVEYHLAYTYDAVGRVDTVVRWTSGVWADWYWGTQIYYDGGGKLWLARQVRWQMQAGPNGPEIINETPVSAMEYRYDGARARYLVRERDPDTMQPIAFEDGRWSMYAGDAIYGDYTVTTNPSFYITGLEYNNDDA